MSINIEQFSHLVIYPFAMIFAKPENRGSNFTWKSFPEMALSYVETQWFLANRNKKIFEKNKAMILDIAKRIAKEFSEITGLP